MRARAKIVNREQKSKDTIRPTIRLTIELVVGTKYPYAFIEGLTDGINYPDGGVIVKSIGEDTYPIYLAANSVGRDIRRRLAEMEQGV